LYKEINFENIKADASGIVVKFPEAKKFPSTRDAITTFEAAVDYIIGQVGQEYAKTMQEADESNNKNKKGGKPNQTAYLSTKQMETLAESRRERFLTEFTQSNKYVEIRTKLQEAIFRLVVEKFKRQIGPGKKIDAATKDKFKAELYIFFQKKLKEIMEIADQKHNLPSDIVSQLESLREASR